MAKRKTYYWRDMTPEEIKDYWRRSTNRLILTLLLLAGVWSLVVYLVR